MATSAVPAMPEITWRDGKRHLWMAGLIVPALPIVGWWLGAIEGQAWGWWIGPMLVFGFIPLMDVLLGRDRENPPLELLRWLEKDRYYRLVIVLYLPVQYASLVLGCWMWSKGTLAWHEALGLAITLGCVSGIGINTAHELGHKTDDAERWLSKIALAQSGYGHFYIEHNRGHHVRVATPEDPASSRLGESFWEFLPRTVSGSLTSAWRIEGKRLRRRHQRLISLGNDIVNAWLMTIVLFGALLIAFGWSILPWLLVQAVFGFCLLEVVNYLEHYGLLRQKMADGRFERVAPRHSWNSDNLVTNVFLYHLQRHSDHHANPTRRYQALRSMEEAPQLPFGYATMILIAWVPPIWRRVMDPRVLRHYDGDVTLANIHPRTRDKVLRRYGRPQTATTGELAA